MNSLDEEESQEVEGLHSYFPEIALEAVAHTYIQNDKDRKETQDALAELARDPEAIAQLMQKLGLDGASPFSAAARQSPDMKLSSVASGNLGTIGVEHGEASSLATLGLANGPPERGASGSFVPAWDMQALTETLNVVGSSVSDGITNLAINITGWVHDLASAFDSGWGEDDSNGPQHSQHDKDEPAVGISGSIGIERPYQRRAMHSGGNTGGHDSGDAQSLMDPYHSSHQQSGDGDGWAVDNEEEEEGTDDRKDD